MDTFADRAITFYESLSAPLHLPRGVEVMEPYRDAKVMGYTKAFLRKFFSDNQKRTLVLGINPGRFGSHMTGIPFTDPIALDKKCGITHSLSPRQELSSSYLYRFIDEWGGVDDFYSKFYVSAICPLGFTKDERNYNYYDDPLLYSRSKSFIVDTLRQQFSLGVSETVIILGVGKNLKMFTDINAELGLFKRTFAVEHPRFIMQYKSKHLPLYLSHYKQAFRHALAL